MTYEKAVELVTKIVCRQRGLAPSLVLEDTDLVQTFGFDSLDAAELLATLHKETGHELSACSVEALTTVASIAGHLAEEGLPGDG